MSDNGQVENIEILKKEMQKQQKELEWSKNRVLKLEKELASSKSTLMINEKEMKEVKETYSQLREENTELKNKVSTLKEKLRLVLPDELKLELKKSKELLTIKENTIDDLNSEITAITNELNESREKFEEEISKTAEKLITLETSKDETINKLKSEINTNQNKMKDLEKLVGKKEAEKDEVMIQMADLKGLQTEFLTEQKKIVGHFGDQDLKIKEQESILRKKQDVINKLKSELGKIQPKAKEDKEKTKLISELQVILDQKDAQIHQLMMDLENYRNAEQKLHNLQSLNEEQKMSNRQKVQGYESFILTLQTELKDVREQLFESETLRAEQQGSIERFEALIGQVQTQMDHKESYTQSAPPAYSASASGGGSADAVKYFFDSLIEKVKSNISALQLASAMSQTRERVEKILPRHGVLLELSTLARQLQEYPEGSGLDTETQALLLAKVEEWKSII